MINKRTIIKITTLFAGLIFLLALSGCANMSTDMKIDGNNFSGSRVMSVTFDMDELLTRLPGGTNDLNNLINTAIPSQLSYRYDVNENEAVYYFTLSFDSKQDYLDKLKNLLGKPPEVTFNYSTGVFTRGVTFNENFESRELFGWFDKLVMDNGLATASQNYSSEKFWNQTGVKVTLDGEEFTCDGGKVNIQSGGYSVVSSIEISTMLKQTGDIERTMMITIPSSTDSSQIVLIENYLNDNIPDGGAWNKRVRSSSIMYTVTFTAGSTARLQTYMERLTNGKCECTLENTQDLSQPLAKCSLLSESLDFSYFGGESKVPVTYDVTSEINQPYQINLVEGDQEISSGAVQDGSKLHCTGEFSAITFKTTLRKLFTVECIDYNLIQNGNDSFIREIVITLPAGTDPSILDNISDYYTIKGAGSTNITVENDVAPMVKIYINGNSKQIMAAEAVLFGGVGARALGYDRSWGMFKLHPETVFSDSFDITSLLNVMNMPTYVYTYSCDGNKITRVICNTNDGQDSKQIKNESEAVGFGLSNGIQTVTIHGYYFNGWAVFFIVLLIIIIIALIAMGVLLYLYKSGKIELPNKKKKEEVPPVAEPLFAPIPEPQPVVESIPLPEPEPEPQPPRDLTENFDDEEAEPTIKLFDTPHIEPEPEPEPSISAEPDMNPVLSYPEKYHPTDEFASREEPEIPVIEPQPEPQPEPVPEPQPEPRDIAADYTDDDMIEDFDALGLLGEYKKHVQKVKVKVRKHPEDTDE